MRRTFNIFIFTATLFLLGAFPTVIQARPQAVLSIAQLAPSLCPAAGCAAGQRINLRASYPVNPLYSSSSNTQVCIYSSMEGSASWADPSIFNVTNTTVYTAGELTSTCTSNLPVGKALLGGAYARFDSASNQDFDFAFRINKTSTLPGSLQIDIYQLNSGGDAWTLSDSQTTSPITTAPAADPAYVAADIAACAASSPCYLNSGDDLPGGIGTGLKDAVEASPASGTISILGSYPIKANTVVLPYAQILQGNADATLTYSGTTCSNPMLQVITGATIQNLNINDGICVSPSRNLIEIDSNTDVKILGNDLVNGKDAITMQNNAGNALVRANRITGNSGYGILRVAGSADGIVKVVANNIFGNRIGYQAECNGKGSADHNFWGAGTFPSSAIANCSYTTGKQLGAAALSRTSLPGIDVQEITLSGSKTGYFADEIFLSGTGGTKLIVVNHGQGGYENIPFFGMGTTQITACSNFFDVFLSDGNGITPSIVNLALPYNGSCAPVIESSSYCGSGDPARYPILWFDPQHQVTDQWDGTGQIPDGSGASGMVGQTTACNTVDEQIEVELDANLTQRPNLVTDLTFTPFVIGYPNQDIVFASFSATAGIAKAELYWETTRESGLKGYYVVRSTNPYGPYSRDSNLILAKGTDAIGGIYSYLDEDLSNGTTYWYMLEMIDMANNTIDFHGPVSATTYSMIPTATDVTPNTAVVYGTSLSIKVRGNNFIPTSIVVWDNNFNINLNTSFIDSTQLTAILPASLLTSSSLHQITVYNPGAGGGSSPPLSFTINNPVPVLNSITPDVSDGNITTLTIDLSGDYFVSTSRVRFNNSDTNVTTTFTDRNHLTAKIARSNLGSGSIQVTVYNPPYGGGTSAAKTFNMYTPTPTLTKVPTAYRSPTSYYYRSPTPYRTSTRTPTRTVTGTIFITPSTTFQLTPVTTGSLLPSAEATFETTPGPIGTETPTLAPGEPTYTPGPGEQGGSGATSLWSWRLLTGMRILGGFLLGAALLLIPAFLVLRIKTNQRKSH